MSCEILSRTAEFVVLSGKRAELWNLGFSVEIVKFVYMR